ncbi:hypothetical protein C8C85_2621 [Flavobacterium sp. 103]|uniref:hypothetical protein n=1 Tax=Flavobacterium sp. 103 TaxID=2135624 RepID=UPI000D5C3FCC|nr:hypothetical protein [Flavobacterium sp. 103]PVX46741.1 hypothetical protein C8C85_2621 [Flavobacterium sp. 103]
MKISTNQIEIVKKIFTEYYANNSKVRLLTIKDIFDNSEWKGSVGISRVELLSRAGINPDCVLTSLKGRYSKDTSFLKSLMHDLSEIVGRENLNDNSMNSKELIEIPNILRLKGQFDLSDKYSVPLRLVTKQSIYASLIRTFDNCSWNEILRLSGYNLSERKKSKFGIDEILELLRCEIIQEYKELDLTTFNFFLDNLNLNDFREDNPQLFKLIHRIPQKIKINSNKVNQFVVGIFFFKFFIEENGNEDYCVENFENYFKSNIDIVKKISSSSRTIKDRKNSKFEIQESILRAYSDGYFGHGDAFGDTTLMRHIHHDKKNSTLSYLESVGIIQSSLRSLKIIIESKYNSKEKIWNRFRELVKESLESNENRLTREYISKVDPQFIRDCFRLENIKNASWSDVLRIYGLNPDIWSNTYSTASKRGLIFQDAIYKIFKSFLIEVNTIDELNLTPNSFIHNKKLGKGIKPDFVFKNFIIDSKFSVSIDKNQMIQIENIQVEKYITELNLPVLVLTFNQKGNVFKTQSGIEIKNINFLKDFKNWIKHEFKVELSDADLTKAIKRINSIPFWKK